MKVAVVHNISKKGVINVFGRQNKELYYPEEINAVVEALGKNGHTAETFEGDKYLAEKLEAFMPPVLKGEKPGIVFNLAYGIQGESRYTHIPSLLEMLGIPYVGSGPLAHSIALDKAMTKIILSWEGLPTPNFQVVSDGSYELNANLRFPLVVKPRDEAVSFGVRVAHDPRQLHEAAREAVAEFQQPALVEEFLNGREFNVGVLGNEPRIEILPPVEIDFGDSQKRYQTFKTKKQGTFGHTCPANIPESLANQLRELALKAFTAIRCCDCARIDFRLDEEGRPYILEINSMPAVHRNGSFFIAAQKAGYDYSGMINRMVESAVMRYFG